MAEEGSGGRETGRFSPETARWLEDAADRRGVSRAQVVDDLVAAYRAAADEGADGSLSALRGDVADLEGELDEQVADVRERVVQVKRETDGKADAAAVAELESSVESLAADVEALRGDLAALEGRVDDGFENYEEVLEYLTEAADDLDGKVERLARATVAVRDGVESLSSARGDEAAVEALQAEANRRGVRSAACEGCGGRVDLALLAAPRCPHCEATLSGIDPKQGFFGSHVLHTGDPPALEAPPDPREAEPELEPEPGVDLADIAEADDD